MYLVAQGENFRYGQYYFGYEVFQQKDSFYLVIHTSTYDGMKRDSHYATPRVAMDAVSQEKAIQEARDKVKAYAESILAVSV